MLFIEWQGYKIEKRILYQNKNSAILLEIDGKSSSGTRIWSMNVHYFFMTDQVEKENVQIKYFPTDHMW